LHPFFNEKIDDEISKCGSFSLGFDSTPHKNFRIYGLTVRYFDGKKIKNRVFDITAMTSEKAIDISEHIHSTCTKRGLSFENLVSLCADNTACNFGGIKRPDKNNVFAILKKSLTFIFFFVN
jgi:hypothetical protein